VAAENPRALLLPAAEERTDEVALLSVVILATELTMMYPSPYFGAPLNLSLSLRLQFPVCYSSLLLDLACD
jgi:hypothetical protein